MILERNAVDSELTGVGKLDFCYMLCHRDVLLQHRLAQYHLRKLMGKLSRWKQLRERVHTRARSVCGC